MANPFYIILNSYQSIDFAGAAIYGFLKKYCLFKDDIFVVCDENISDEEKKFLSNIYYKISFKKLLNDYGFLGTNISKFDCFFSPIEVQNNKELLNDFNNWKSRYYFNDNVRFPKHEEDSDKYIVFTCAKNENDYIVEWVEHYLKLGFDKIIICDNNDDNSLETVLHQYIEKGTVEIFDCRTFTKFQERAFQMFCEEGNYKWCGYFDCDEFLEIGAYSNIKDYLSQKNEDCLAFNWVIFGSDGQLDKKQGNLSERFKVPYLPVLNINNGFLKGLTKGGRFRFRNIEFKGGHLPYPVDDNIQENTYNIGGYFHTEIAPYQTSYPLRYKEGYVKHYYTKSFEEWIDKASRGWPIDTESLPYYRYFLLESKENLKENQYEKCLFLRDDYFEFAANDAIDFLKENDIIELAQEKSSTYAFASAILYIMSKVKNKVILIKSEKINDFLFNLMFEYSFINGNKLIFCQNDDEVYHAYVKYRKSEESIYFWKVL